MENVRVSKCHRRSRRCILEQRLATTATNLWEPLRVKDRVDVLNRNVVLCEQYRDSENRIASTWHEGHGNAVGSKASAAVQPSPDLILLVPAVCRLRLSQAMIARC